MWYLHSAFEAYRKVQDTVESRLSEVRSAALSPLNLMKNLLSGPPASPPDAELAHMRERIAELEARLGKPKPPKPRKRAKK
jgi:BMFP domain-containing protein YqiC